MAQDPPQDPADDRTPDDDAGVGDVSAPLLSEGASDTQADQVEQHVEPADLSSPDRQEHANADQLAEQVQALQEQLEAMNEAMAELRHQLTENRLHTQHLLDAAAGDDTRGWIQIHQRLINELQNRPVPAPVDPLDLPHPPVFIAKQGASSLQWQERCFKNGATVDYTDGRKCTSDSDPSAIVALASDEFPLLESIDPNSGTRTTRYVKIGGGNPHQWMIIKDPDYYVTLGTLHTQRIARCRTFLSGVEGSVDIFVKTSTSKVTNQVFLATQLPTPYYLRGLHGLSPRAATHAEVPLGAVVQFVVGDKITVSGGGAANAGVSAECFPWIDSLANLGSPTYVTFFHKPAFGDLIQAVAVASGHENSTTAYEFVEIPGHWQGEAKNLVQDTYPRTDTWDRYADGQPVRIPRERTQPYTGDIYRWVELYDQHGKLVQVGPEELQAVSSDPYGSSFPTHSTSDAPHLTSSDPHVTSSPPHITSTASEPQTTSTPPHTTSTPPHATSGGAGHVTTDDGPVHGSVPASSSTPGTGCPTDNCVTCDDTLSVSYTAPVGWSTAYNGAYFPYNSTDGVSCDWYVDTATGSDSVFVDVYCAEGQWFCDVYRGSDGDHPFQQFHRIAPAAGDGDCPDFSDFWTSDDGGTLLVG